MIDWFLALLWRSLPIIALCSVLVAVLPDRLASLRRQLAVLGLCALPFMALLLPIAEWAGWRLSLPWFAAPTAAPEQAASTGALTRLFEASSTSPVTLAQQASVEAATPWGAYGLGLLVSVMVLGAGLGLWRWARRLRALASLAEQARYTRQGVPRLGYHQRLDSPLCFGWRRPTILLPEQARAWTPAQRARALAHEQAHLRNGDWPTQQLIEGLLCLFWWHPLYWYLRRSFLRDIEILADAEAVRRTRDRQAYAQDLLSLASSHLPTPAAALAMRPQPPLVQRLNMLINQTEVIAMKPLHVAAIQLTTAALVLLLSLCQVQAHDGEHEPISEEIEREIRIELEDARTELRALVENGILEQELLDELEMIGDLEISIDGDTKIIRGESIDGDEIRRIVIEAVGQVDEALAELADGEMRKHRIVTINRHESEEHALRAEEHALAAHERAVARLERQLEREREALERARERAEERARDSRDS